MGNTVGPALGYSIHVIVLRGLWLVFYVLLCIARVLFRAFDDGHSLINF